MSSWRSPLLGAISIFALSSSLPLPVFAQSSLGTARRTVPRLTPRLQQQPTAPPSAPAPSKAPEGPAREDAPSPARSSPPVASGSSFEPEPLAAPAPREPSLLQPANNSTPPSGGFRPPYLPVYGNSAPPVGYVEKSHFNVPFLVGGGLTLLVSYGGGLIYGGSEKFENGLGNLAIPVLGPWLAVGKISVKCENVSSSSNPTLAAQAYENCQKEGVNAVKRGVSLIGFGVAQMAGAIVMALGFIDTEKQWVRADLAGVEVTFDAYTFPSSSGFVATGSF